MKALHSGLAKKLNGERASGTGQPLQALEQDGPSRIFFGLPDSQDQGPERLTHQVQSNFLYLQKKLSSSSVNVKQAVMLDSRIKHGNPVFVGTRIPLYRIVEELADGATLEEIVDGYPSLDVQQIKVALDFVSSLLRIYDD